MHQPDRPTFAWAVIQNYGAPAVREIIGRTPAGVRLRTIDHWRAPPHGELCAGKLVKAEFATQAEADAAVARWAAAYKAATPAFERAYEACCAADKAMREARDARETAASEALKGA